MRPWVEDMSAREILALATAKPPRSLDGRAIRNRQAEVRPCSQFLTASGIPSLPRKRPWTTRA
jgi:hypothetical protein